jgi:hypothetical protein
MFGECTRERLGGIEREEQREPLPRPQHALRESRQQHGERQRLQRQPRRMSAERRQHQFP